MLSLNTGATWKSARNTTAGHNPTQPTKLHRRLRRAVMTANPSRPTASVNRKPASSQAVPTAIQKNRRRRCVPKRLRKTVAARHSRHHPRQPTAHGHQIDSNPAPAGRHSIHRRPPKPRLPRHPFQASPQPAMVHPHFCPHGVERIANPHFIPTWPTVLTLSLLASVLALQPPPVTLPGSSTAPAHRQNPLPPGLSNLRGTVQRGSALGGARSSVPAACASHARHPLQLGQSRRMPSAGRQPGRGTVLCARTCGSLGRPGESPSSTIEKIGRANARREGCSPLRLIFLLTTGTRSLPWDLVGEPQPPVPAILGDSGDALSPKLINASECLLLAMARQGHGPPCPFMRLRKPP
jgi:hypothetical protein